MCFWVSMLLIVFSVICSNRIVGSNSNGRIVFGNRKSVRFLVIDKFNVVSVIWLVVILVVVSWV